MKLRFCDTITVKCIFAILLFGSLFTSTSTIEIEDSSQFHEQNQHSLLPHNTVNENLINELEEKKVDHKKNSVITSEESKVDRLKTLTIEMLKIIFYQYLTVRDLQLKSMVISKYYQHILDPEDIMKAMWGRLSTLNLNLANREWLLNMNFQNVPKFHPKKIFSIARDKFVIVTNENKIIYFHNPYEDYAQLFLCETRKRMMEENPYNNNLFNTFKTHHWFSDGTVIESKITKDGKLELEGTDEILINNMPQNMTNVKKVCSIGKLKVMFVLNDEGEVFSWGYKNWVPEQQILKQWKNVKNIFTIGNFFCLRKQNDKLLYWTPEQELKELQFPKTFPQPMEEFKEVYADRVTTINDAVMSFCYSENLFNAPRFYPMVEKVKLTFSNMRNFVAIHHDGAIEMWGEDNTDIPDHLKKLLNDNVSFIYTTYFAFAALLYDGRVYAWGSHEHGGEIAQGHLENIQSIISNQGAFAAISENGDVHAWGPANFGGHIPKKIKPKLKNVKMICSSYNSFCALTSSQDENGEIMSSVYAWGACAIPEHFKPLLTNVQIKMIFSTALCFLVLFENGRVLGWRKRMSPHEVEANKIDINDETQKVVNVFPRNFDVTFLFENRNVRTLNLNWRQQDYLTIDDLDLEEEGEHGQGYGHENAHEDGDEYENQYDFEDN